jgi:hypothetical protein
MGREWDFGGGESCSRWCVVFAAWLGWSWCRASAVTGAGPSETGPPVETGPPASALAGAGASMASEKKDRNQSISEGTGSKQKAVEAG